MPSPKARILSSLDDIAPAAWDAHLGYADALREAAQCRDAAAEYDAVLRLRPGQEDARRGLARCR